jgi:hypothetical protein
MAGLPVVIWKGENGLWHWSAGGRVDASKAKSLFADIKAALKLSAKAKGWDYDASKAGEWCTKAFEAAKKNKKGGAK